MSFMVCCLCRCGDVAWGYLGSYPADGWGRQQLVGPSGTCHEQASRVATENFLLVYSLPASPREERQRVGWLSWIWPPRFLRWQRWVDKGTALLTQTALSAQRTRGPGNIPRCGMAVSQQFLGGVTGIWSFCGVLYSRISIFPIFFFLKKLQSNGQGWNFLKLKAKERYLAFAFVGASDLKMVLLVIWQHNIHCSKVADF